MSYLCRNTFLANLIPISRISFLVFTKVRLEMSIDKDLLIGERSTRGWSQQQLAEISSLSLRTIQRIEKTGVSSKDSLQAIASAFDKEPSYFFIAVDKTLPRKRLRNIFVTIASIITMAISGFYLTQVSAETIAFDIEYRSELVSSQEINEADWHFLATVGSRSELDLPNDFILKIYPAVHFGGEVTFEVSLISALGESLIANHNLPTAVGTQEDGVQIYFEKEGGLLVNISVNAAK